MSAMVADPVTTHVKKSFPWSFVAVTLIVAVAGVAALVSQLQETRGLRTELALAGPGVGEIERLRAENQRLKEKRISPVELEALRADHAALPRLRAEMDALRKQAN